MLIKMSAETNYELLNNWARYIGYCNYLITYINSNLHKSLGDERFKAELQEGITLGEIFYNNLIKIAKNNGLNSSSLKFDVIYEKSIIELEEDEGLFIGKEFLLNTLKLLPDFEKMVRDILK